MKKKIAVILMISALVVTMLPTAALAAGNDSTNGLCTVEDCNITGVHQHDGSSYEGHTLNDGHDYHQACTVKGCTKTTNHEHNGVACMPHNSKDGHKYHNGNGNHNGNHSSKGKSHH